MSFSKEEYAKEYYRKNKDKIKLYAEKYRKENPDKIKEFNKKYSNKPETKEKRGTKEAKEKQKIAGKIYRSKPEKRDQIKKYRTEYKKSENGIERAMDNNFRKKYGISVDDYRILFEKQNGCCAICSTPQSSLDRKLAVDHNHTTLEIRGLLCIKCNLGIGNLNDNIEIVDKALQYLKYFNIK